MTLVELQSFSAGSGGVQVPGLLAQKPGRRQPPLLFFSPVVVSLPPSCGSVSRLSRWSSGGGAGGLYDSTCVSGSVYLRGSHGKDGGGRDDERKHEHVVLVSDPAVCFLR